jgi:hypothetical protein
MKTASPGSVATAKVTAFNNASGTEKEAIAAWLKAYNAELERHGLDRAVSVKSRPVMKIKPRFNRNGRPAIRYVKRRTLIPYVGAERPLR